MRQALHYLQRFSASEQGLRDVLRRRASRAARHHAQADGEIEVFVDQVVGKLKDLGFLDDRRFAEARAGSLARAGRSGRRIRETLAKKGVAEDLIEDALRGAEEETSEQARALAHAERKRLGPFRAEPDPARRVKDLAAMARAGFSYSLALRVIDGEIGAPGQTDEES